MSKKILIAKVNSAFGIKGEVKIIVYSDNPQNIEKYTLSDSKGNSLKLRISNKNKAEIGNSSGNPILIAKIEGCDDRNAAESMRGQEIFTNRADFDELSEDEFYYSDLIGLDVLDMESKKIGTVFNVMDLGAGGIIEIKFSESQAEESLKEIENFPFKDEIFPEVNLQKNFLRFNAPEILEK